jgi:hypothetical protein
MQRKYILQANCIPSENIKNLTNSVSSVDMPERRAGSYIIAHSNDVKVPN